MIAYPDFLKDIISEALNYVETAPERCFILAQRLSEYSTQSQDNNKMWYAMWQQCLRGIAQARSEHDTALTLLRETRAFSLEQQDYLLQILSACYLGVAYADTGRSNEAMKMSYEALELCKHHDYEHYTIIVARCYSNLGSVYFNFSFMDKVLDCHLKTFEIYQAHHPELVYRALGNIALTQHYLGQMDKAEAMYHEAISAAIKAKDMLGHIIFTLNLATFYRDNHKYDHALTVANHLLHFFDSMHAYQHLRSNVYTLLGDVHQHPPTRLAYYHCALEHLKKYPDPFNEIEILQHLAQYYQETNEHERAVAYFQYALPKATTLKRKDAEYKIHEQLAYYHAHIEEYEFAYEHLKQAYAIQAELFEENKEAHSHSLIFSYELEQAKRERDRIEKHNQELTKANEELADSNRQLSVEAITDPLTAIHNRRYLQAQLTKEYQYAQHHALPLSAVLCDIDHFKKINDRFLHAIGDKVLQVLGLLLQQAVRAYDTVARYGGEEFAIILPNTGNDDAVHIAEKIRATVQNHHWHTIHEGLAVTISLGVASGTEYDNADALLDAADKNLYLAKHQGRNRVVGDRVIGNRVVSSNS